MEESLRKFLIILLVLIGVSTNSFAIGDSGGCTYPKNLIDTASFGTPEQLNVLIEQYIDRKWENLENRTRELIQSDTRALKEWTQDTRNNLINTSVPCGTSEWLLGHAVANSNLDIVHWLLDAGVNPTGAERESDPNTLFARCPAPYPGSRRPDGMAHEEAMKRTIEAYRLLVSRGGDLNRVVSTDSGGYPENALSRCRNQAMWPILIELGVDRSPKSKDKAPRFAPLQNEVRLALYNDKDRISKVQILATDGFNDLRGTRVETHIFERCRIPENEKICEALAKLVRVSPGMIPGLPSSSKLGAIVSDEFSKIKEACFFPELQFYTDLEILSILGDKGKPLGAAFDWRDGEVQQLDVMANHQAKPIILYLQSKRPTLWNVNYTQDTKIAAVIVSNSNYVPNAYKIVGLSSDVPVFAGTCSRWVAFNPPEFHPLKQADPQALDPLKRPMKNTLTIASSDRVVVGDGLTRSNAMMPSSIWTLESIGAAIEKPEQLTGRAALEDLVRKGKLQRANANVYTRWMHDALGNWWTGGIPKTVPPFWDGYYLYETQQLKLPPGLSGPNAPVIFVHEDVQDLGELGNTTIFYLKSSKIDGKKGRGGRCFGPRC